MKRILLAAALAAVAPFTFAEPPAGPPPGVPFGGPPIEQLARDLDLTPAQQVEVQRIFAARFAKLQAEHERIAASGAQGVRIFVPHPLHDPEVRAQLAAVLTPEQMAKFDTLPKRPMQQGDRQFTEAVPAPR